MAGKKQVKKAAAKKAAKKAPARKAAAGGKKAGGKKVGQKKAVAKKASAKPPARTVVKGEVYEVEVERERGGGPKSAADKLGKEWERSWARIVAKTWTDPDFKAKLMLEPAQILAAEGLPLLHDVDIRIVAGEGRFTMEIPLPDRPGDLDGEKINDLLIDIDDHGGLKPKKCVMSSCCC